MIQRYIFSATFWIVWMFINCTISVLGQNASFSTLPNSTNGTITVCQGSSIVFTNTSTGIGANAEFEWQFNGGSPQNQNSVGPHTITFSTVGNFTVTLTVNDTLSSSVNINVVNPNFNPSNPSLTAPSTANLGYSTNTLNGILYYRYCGTLIPYSSNIPFYFNLPQYPSGTVVTINWGDNTSTTLNNGSTAVNHTFPGASQNIFTMTVNYALPNGCTLSQTYGIFLGIAPTIQLSGNGNSACIPNSYNFNLLTNNVPNTTYVVIFNDNSAPDTLIAPFNSLISHSFNTTSCGTTSVISGQNGTTISYANSFASSIIATNACGSTFSSIGPIYVSESVDAQIGVEPNNTICITEELVLSNISNPGSNVSGNGCDTFNTFYWNVQPPTGFTLGSGSSLGDGSSPFWPFWTSGSDELSIQFSGPGTYEIDLVTANGCGTDSTTQTITVLPIATIPNQTATICTGGTFNVQPANNPPSVIVPTGTLYTWTVVSNPNVSGEVSQPIPQASISGTLINNTNQSQVVTYVVTPYTSGCAGDTFLVSVTVVPGLIFPNYTATICNGGTFSITPTNNPPTAIIPAGTTYNWVPIPNGNVTGEVSGSGSSISGTLSTSILSPAQSVTYNVTANASVTCPAQNFQITIFINGVTPPVIGQDQTVCSSGDPASFSTSTFATGSGTISYQWQSANSPTGVFASIPNSNVVNFNPPAGIISTTYYQVAATSTLNNVECTAMSNVLQVTVNNVNPGVLFPNQTICSGGDPSNISPQIFPSGNGTLTYQWQSSTTSATSGFTNISGATSNSYDPPAGLTSTTYYQLVVTSTLNSVSCSAITTPVTVTVNNVNPGTIASNQTICASGNPAILSASVGATGSGTLSYAWSSSTTSNSSGFTPIGGATLASYDPPAGLTTTTYYQVAVNSTLNGVSCSGNSNVVTVTINDIVAPVVSSSQTICSGGNPDPFIVQTTASGSGNLTYQWQSSTTSSTSGFTAIGSATSSSYDAPNGLTSTTYYQVVTTSTLNGVTCQQTSNTLTVTVNTVSAGTVTGNQTICSGGNPAPFTTVSSPTGLGVLSYQWQSSTTSASSGFAAINGASNATFDPPSGITVTTYYQLVVTSTLNGVACSATSATLTVNVNQITASTIGSNQTICSGGNPSAFTVLTGATGSSVLTYSWQSSTTSSTTGYTSIPSAFSATYDPPTGLTTTTYYQVVTTSTLNGIACSATSNPLLVTVVSNPTANAGPDANVSCLNNSPGVTIGMGSIGGVNYSWSPSNGLSSSTLSNPTASPLTTTTYALTATDIAFGCSSTDQVIVNVNLAVPSVEAGNNFTITCVNNASGAGVGMTASTGVNYSWSPSNGLSSSSISNPNANPSSTTTYTLTATNTASGCTATDQVTVTVSTTTPIANAGADFTKTCVLNPNGAAIGDAAINGVSYSWSPAAGLSSSTASNPTANPAQTTTYTVTATNTANGCTSTDDVIVTVDNSFPSVNAGVDQVICQGSTVTLTASGTNQYSWSNGVINGVSFVPTATTTFTVTGTDLTTGCVSTDVVTVTVNPIPTVNPLSNQVLCNAGATNAIVFAGNVPSTVFNWTNSSTSIGLAASGQGAIPSFIATNATNAQVISTLTVQPLYTNLGVTCTGTSQNMTFTINPTPQVNPVNNQGVCVGSTTSEIIFSSSFGVAGTSYLWSNSNSAIGISTSGNGNVPAFTGTNGGTIPINGSFQVTPSYTNQNVTCNGTPQSFIVTINPTPNVVDPADVVVCNNVSVPLITFSGSNANTIYTWTNNTTSINLPSTGTSAISSFPATNLSNAPVTAAITVTPSLTNAGITCTGTSELFTITVNPTPSVDPLTSQAICVGSSTSTVNFTSNQNVSGTIYSWINSNASIGLASTGTGPITSFTTTNTGNTPQTGTITVTPSVTLNSITCTGTTQSMNIVVNPIPTVVDPLDQVVCNGGLTQAVNFSGAVSGTVYTWTNSNPLVNLVSSGTGSIASFVATNATNSPISATITVTPSFTNAGATCTGTTQSFTITVNPTPTVDPLTNQTLCVGSSTNSVIFTSGFGVSGTTFNWTNSNVTIGLASSGNGNIGSFTSLNSSNSPSTGTLFVTPSYVNQNVTCNGTSQSFSIIVNPIPTITDPIDQILCNSSQSNAVNFSGAATGTVYNWTNSTTSINLSASGTGNIPGFNAINATNTPVTATVTVTPVFTNAGTSCTGNSTDFTIAVVPTPTVDGISNQVECVGSPTDAVLFTSAFGVSGTIFTWTNSNATIGLGANGSGNIPSFTTINNGNTMQSGTISVVPSVSFNGTTCQGTTENFTISVNPIPTVLDPLDQVVCAGTLTNAVNFTGAVSGTVYTWAASNTAIGVASGSTGNLLPFITTNTTNAPIQSIITVTPSYQFGGTLCTGSSQSFTITINPTPTVDAFANQGLCLGESSSPINFSSAFGVNGTQFNWTNSNTGIGLQAVGTGPIGSFTAMNTSNNPVNATITVTPQLTSGGIQCQGAAQTAVITVNPIPTVNDPLDQVICNGSPSNGIIFNGLVSGTIYNWSNSNTTIGLGSIAIGNIPSFTGENSGTSPVTGTITITPSFTNASTTCFGSPQTMTISVNPTPSVTDPQDITSCNGGTIATIDFQGTGTQYTWTNSLPSIGLTASGTGTISSFTALNTTANPITATVSVQPNYLNAGLNCPGAIQSFLITVNPSPEVNFSLPNQTICSQTLSNGVTISSPTSNATITWNIPNPPLGITGLTVTNGTTNIPPMTLGNTTSNPITINVFASASTPGALACPGAGSLYTITVNPIPQLLDPIDQVVCSGASTVAVTFNGSGTSYNWTNSSTTIGLTSSGIGAVPAFVAQNNTSGVVTSTVTVTPFYFNNSVNCPGPNQTYTYTVNYIPTVNAISDFTICNGEVANPVTFGGTGTTYNWTNNNPAIGLVANGIGGIPAFQGTNSSTTAITGSVSVTPIFENQNVSCQGSIDQVLITVNPTPTVNDPLDQVICNSTTTATVNFTGTGTSYVWTNSNTGIGLGANGIGNINAFNALNSSAIPITSTVIVTPQFTGTNLTCPGPPQTFTYAINPTPTVDNPLDQVVCNGETTQLISVNGTGTSYAWVNNVPSIGLPASGTGNVSSFLASNPNSTPLIVTITLTPIFTGSSVSCVGPTQDVQFTINPTPSLVDPSDQVVCNGSVTTGVNFSGNGTSYTWINSNPSIGLAASGTGNIAPFTALNNSNSPITATITVIPNFTGGLASCNGANQSFTITINPSPTVADLPDQTICNGSSTSPLNFTGTGTSYAWINSNTTIGLSGSGSNNITSFTAVNNGSSPISGTVTVTAQYTNANLTCNGQQQAIVFTVNPIPTVITPANITICNGSSSPTVVIGGTATSYSWTNSNPSIGLSANGTGNIPSFSAVNASNGAITATITITPIFALNGETCYGNDQQFTLTVNPTPTVSDPLDQTICNGSLTTAVNFIGTGNNYSWTTTNTSIGLSSSGNGNIPIFTGINTGSTPLLALVQVTPEYTNSGIVCSGPPQIFQIEVSPTPVVNDPLDVAYCNNGAVAAVTFSGTATNYSWTNTVTTIGLAANGIGSISSFQGTNTTQQAITSTVTVTPFFTNPSLTCPGQPQNFTITINPTPTVVDPLDQVVCNQSQTNAISFSGSATTFNWTNSLSTIGLPVSGIGNIAPFVALNTTSIATQATLFVTPTFIGSGISCPGNPVTFTISVNPSPHVNTIAPITICNNETFNVSLSSDIPSVFSWNALSSIPVTGEVILPQTSSSISNTLTNTSSVLQNVIYTVTPVSVPAGCIGPDSSFLVTVVPDVLLSLPPSIEICSGASVNAVLSANIGANFSWFTTFDNPNVLGESITTSSGALINDVLINTTNTNQVVIYSVTPTSIIGNCTGAAQTIAVTVKPPLELLNEDSVTICSGSSVGLNLEANTTVTFNWYANPTISIGGESINVVSSSLISDVLTNTTSTYQEITYFVIGSSTVSGCSSPIIPIHVTVNPLPVLSNLPDITFCSGIVTPAITFGTTQNVTYEWDNANSSIGLPLSGNGPIQGFLTTGSNSIPTNAAISVTPTYTHNSISCIGTNDQFLITINPTPTINPIADLSLCEGGTTTAINFSSQTVNTIFSWVNTESTIGLGATGSGNIPSFVVSNSTNSPLIANVSVVPSFSNNGVSCSGNNEDFLITVHPLASLLSSGGTICSEQNVNLNLNTDIPSAISWQAVNNLNINGESLVPQLSSTLTDQLTNLTTTQQTVNYIVSLLTNGFGCTSGPFTVPVLIHPNPVAIFTTTTSPLCDLSPVQFQNLSTGATDYLWDFGNANISTATNPAFTFGSFGSFNVELIASNAATGCTDSLVLPIVLQASPPVNFTSSVNEGCVTLEVIFTDLNNTPFTELLWDFGDGATSAQPGNIDHQYINEGCYDVTLTVTNAGGCSSTLTTTDMVCVYDLPIADFSFTPDSALVSDPIVEFTNLSTNSNTYLWEFGDGNTSNSTNPIHEYEQNTETYYITLFAYNEIGCVDTSVAEFIVYEDLIFYVPNSFTPNNDGTNDVFLPVITAGLDDQKYTLLIFNRWGEIVFESNDPSVGWDGSYLSINEMLTGNETNAQSGVYTWKILLNKNKNEGAVEKVGHVTLLR